MLEAFLMKKNILVLLFQTVTGTLNLINCWVCHPPIRLLSSDHRLIVISFNFTEKSIGNSKGCPSSYTLHAKHLSLLPHAYPHVFRSLHSGTLWGRLLVDWTIGTVWNDCLLSVLCKQGLDSIIQTEFGNSRAAIWLGGHVGTQVDCVSQVDVGPPKNVDSFTFECLTEHH